MRGREGGRGRERSGGRSERGRGGRKGGSDCWEVKRSCDN